VEIKDTVGNVLYTDQVADDKYRDFSEKYLRGAILTGKNVSGSNFRRTDLMRANLDNACAGECNFLHANLYEASLENTKLARCNLSCVDLGRANLNNAYLGYSNFSGAYLKGASLVGANLSETVLNGVFLADVDLTGAALPSPTMMLLANWGRVSDELTRDLMNYDAFCHPKPERFDNWAKSGPCPYSFPDKELAVQRAAVFSENPKLWDPSAPLQRPYDLMIRLLKEKTKTKI
jgi:hypothetical protein